MVTINREALAQMVHNRQTFLVVRTQISNVKMYRAVEYDPSGGESVSLRPGYPEQE